MDEPSRFSSPGSSILSADEDRIQVRPIVCPSGVRSRMHRRSQPDKSEYINVKSTRIWTRQEVHERGEPSIRRGGSL